MYAIIIIIVYMYIPDWKWHAYKRVYYGIGT